MRNGKFAFDHSPKVMKSAAKAAEVTESDNFQTMTKHIGMIRVPKVTQNSLIPT